MKEKSGLFAKYWWIPLTAFLVGGAALFFFFGDKNNPSIKSVGVSSSKVEQIQGKDRRIVAAIEFKQFFYDNLGFEDSTMFDTYDSNYVLVEESDVLSLRDIFFQYLKENDIKYTASVKDCDDFAKIFSRLFADKWHFGKEYKVSPAVGYFAYLNRNDVYHMVVVAFSERDGKLHPMFFETRPELTRVDINEDEFLSMIGGEFN